MNYDDRFPKGTRQSWQTAGHNRGIGAQPCEECGALVAATSDGRDLRQVHSNWHDQLSTRITLSAVGL